MNWHVQITEGDEKLAHTDPEHWTTWRNCRPGEKEVTLGMIVHKHLRDRGGLAWDEKLDVTVWYFTDATPRYPNGRPMCLDAVRFTCTKTGEHACRV